MRRKACTDDRYLQCLFCKLFNRDRYGNACRIIRRFTDLCSCTVRVIVFVPFFISVKTVFAWFSVSSTMSLAYTLTVDGEIRILPDTWKPGFVWIVPSNTTGISFFIRLLYAASIDWGSKPTSEVVASNCFCMSLWIVFW